ncbi:hypothetical protein D1872_296180 [compost metagenome]
MGFRHSVSTHQPPFVMVTGKPGFGQVAKRLIFVDFLRVEVAVIIDDRHIGGVFVVERLGHIGG